ncbi:MAG: nuclear transport factor 2 family protein [Ferruginibacter sp.]
MKHSFFGFVAITLSITFFSACSNEAATTDTTHFNLDSVKAAIAVSNKAFGESWATGDSAKFANCYTTDGVMSPPNMPAIAGTAAVTAFFNEGYKWGIRNIALKTNEVFGSKDCVVETGTYELFMENNVSGDKGKFIVMWKEENRKWKMYRDLWNSDLPALPPPPAETK